MIGSLAFALAMQRAIVTDNSWSCATRYEIDGRMVSMWRDFDDLGTVFPYHIQTVDKDPTRTHWTIYPLADGPPAEEYGPYKSGRSEAEVLANGPDYVHISYNWQAEVKGPVWALFWGDGSFVGAEQLFSAKQVRRFTRNGKMGGLSGGISAGPILSALYRTKEWRVTAFDANMKLLADQTFKAPDLARSLDNFHERRAALERLEAEFRGDFKDRTSDGVTCAMIDLTPVI